MLENWPECRMCVQESPMLASRAEMGAGSGDGLVSAGIYFNNVSAKYFI
jgi:hypothetical protein